MDWNTLFPRFCRDFEHENAGRWSNKERLHLLQQGSDNIISQHCLNSDGLIIYMRAIQGHSGGTTVDPALLDNVEIPYIWSEYFYHVCCSRLMHSIFQARTDCRKKRMQIRETTNSILHRLGPHEQRASGRTPIFPTPRKVHYKSKWK